MHQSFHLKLEPDTRMFCHFGREHGFIFNCKPFSFKGRICFLVGADRKELNKINGRHLEAGGQQTETAEYFIAQVVLL